MMTDLWRQDEIIVAEKIFEVFEEELEKISCQLCKQIHIWPKGTPCGHRFCRPCIESWLSTNNTCPVDNKPVKVEQLVDLKRDQQLMAILNIRVRCRNCHKGCDKWFTVVDIDRHMTECEFNDKHIKSKNCQKGVNQLEMEVIENFDDIEDKTKEVKINRCRVDFKDNMVTFNFGLKFRLIRVDNDQSLKEDIRLIKCRWRQTLAVFEDDTAFAIQVDNADNKRSIRFTITIQNTSQTFVVRTGMVCLLRSLEENGKHLRYCKADSDDGEKLVGEKATKEGIGLAKAEKILSIIDVTNIDIEKDIDDKIVKGAKPKNVFKRGAWNGKKKGVICVGDATDQKFKPYLDNFIVGKRYRGFRVHVSSKSKYDLL